MSGPATTATGPRRAEWREIVAADGGILAHRHLFAPGEARAVCGGVDRRRSLTCLPGVATPRCGRCIGIAEARARRPEPSVEQVTARLPEGWRAQRLAPERWTAHPGGVLRPTRAPVSATDADELVARVARQAALVDDLACCPRATRLGCVCHKAFRCPEHGERHHGTHD